MPELPGSIFRHAGVPNASLEDLVCRRCKYCIFCIQNNT
jgi:hypothetical protein